MMFNYTNKNEVLITFLAKVHQQSIGVVKVMFTIAQEDCLGSFTIMQSIKHRSKEYTHSNTKVCLHMSFWIAIPLVHNYMLVLVQSQPEIRIHKWPTYLKA